MDDNVNSPPKKALTLGQYFAVAIRHFASLINQDLFIIDSFKYLEDGDLEVTYGVNGKRKPVLCKKLSQIAQDPKLISCFSRDDVFELGIFYGQLREKKSLFNNKLTGKAE